MNNKKIERNNIINKLLKVDCLTAYFIKTIKEFFSDPNNIEISKCHHKVFVEYYGYCNSYIIKEKSSKDYYFVFKIVTLRYDKNNKSMTKVIKVL